MYIHEAVKEAVEKDCCITILEKDGKIAFKIKPEKIIVGGFCKVTGYPSYEKLNFEKWVPNYYELISDKWDLVDNDLKILESNINIEWWQNKKS